MTLTKDTVLAAFRRGELTCAEAFECLAELAEEQEKDRKAAEQRDEDDNDSPASEPQRGSASC